ncbi:MAG: transcriptional repressor [Anaerolineales bacterium]|nr:transcriptional repressor [Anaerolineales bacterium]
MNEPQAVLDTLRARRFRITPQREMVVEALFSSEQHKTAEDVFALVQMRTTAVNIATIYRTLDMLVEQGIASRTDLGGQMIYTPREHGPHIHLVCHHCSVIVDADAGVLAALDAQLQREYNFRADLGHISLFGVCAGCQD